MDDYFYGNGISVVEWADNVIDFLPKKRVELRFSKDLSRGDSYRKIRFLNMKK
jgi:tRNA threonylcarbamoyladenosine biosynthesis protein TsaE